MSSELWNWTAVVVGLRSGDGVFIPTYWRMVASLTAPFGWVPSPHLLAFVLALVSVLGVVGYVRSRRSWCLCLAFVLWGALLADTPLVLLLPPLVGIGWIVAARVAKNRSRRLPSLYGVPWKRVGVVWLAAFVSVCAGNIVQSNGIYVAGYVVNALSELRLGGWHPFDVAEMDRILDAYVTELAREAEGHRWIFTDGICDAGIDLKGSARAVSLSGGSRSVSHWQRVGFAAQEDLLAVKSGPAALLRAWVKDRPAALTNAVYQCGFTFLEKEAPDRMEPCGLVLRSVSSVASGCSADSAAAATRELAERILAFYRDGGLPSRGGLLRAARFCSMQWRVARALRRQSRAFDRQRRLEEAFAASELSEQLDAVNPYARRQSVTTEPADLRAFGSLTPREGLNIALQIANIALARQYATAILKDDPNNVDANFALAMDHFKREEYAQARCYFQQALEVRPNDSTLLNNLALSSLELGDLKDAAEKAKAAQKLNPDSEAIRDTLRKVEWRKNGK